MNRRTFILAAAALPFLFTGPGLAAVSPRAIVHTDPSCGCCGSWVKHLRQAGFAVDIRETTDIVSEKIRLGVPDDLASCHTAEIDGYVVEGHVPAGAIRRLLAERPEATGLSVPGMPIGSPGMAVPGREPDLYEVVLFGPAGQSVFASYHGEVRLL